MKYTDKELLDFLQELNDKNSYTGKCILRNSTTQRGWRLHETSIKGANPNVREAIIYFMKQYKKFEKEILEMEEYSERQMEEIEASVTLDDYGRNKFDIEGDD